MTQMLEGPPPVPPEPQWSPPDQQWCSFEEQWTDWGRPQASRGGPKARRGFIRAAVVVPLGVLTALIVIVGVFLLSVSQAGAAGLCGGG